MFVAFALTAAAQPVVDVAPRRVDFGIRPFESETVRSFTVGNPSDLPLLITIDPVAVGDDFAPGLVTSTCGLSTPTILLPGEDCTHDVRFRPTEAFAGLETATLEVTVRSGAWTAHRPVTLAGVGVAPGARWDRVVDFGDHGEGSLDPAFFDRDGVRFVDEGFVGFVQGDEALVGSSALGNAVRFRVRGPLASVTVSFAPAVQGTALYELSALGPRDRVLASTERLLTQDSGTSSATFGYVDIALSEVPPATRTLVLTGTFVGSSFPGIEEIPFGVSRITLAGATPGTPRGP
jgi:hypothetical protein